MQQERTKAYIQEAMLIVLDYKYTWSSPDGITKSDILWSGRLEDTVKYNWYLFTERSDFNCDHLKELLLKERMK